MGADNTFGETNFNPNEKINTIIEKTFQKGTNIEYIGNFVTNSIFYDFNESSNMLSETEITITIKSK